MASEQNLNGQSDEECIRIGTERFDALPEDQRAKLFMEMCQTLVRRGWSPSFDVVMHVAGNVSEAEWSAVVARTPRDN